ncbi:MAG: DUF177 domain-containing protein [Muribaculaceae bacterium]|nr:DUF177 domain-containing protein [Muribaculaceae bacterium]MBR1474390.1 DUF177 domain-containing protein [Muribaculaceae bacterium]
MAGTKLRLRSLPFDTQVFSYHLDGDFFNQVEKTEVRSSSVDITVQVTRTTDNTYVLQMDCKGWLTVACDRCLDDLRLDVDTDYRVTVRQEGDEWDDRGDDVLLIPETWSELDLTELMRDTVLLTIPIVHCHADGECDPEMMAHLGEHWADTEPTADGPSSDAESPLSTDESDDAIDPRWEALRKLKDNN